MKLALSLLCENPEQNTSLSVLFRGFVEESLRLYDNLEWVVFIGAEMDWESDDERLQLVRTFPGNNRLGPRLMADHFRVGPAAKRHGASVLVTIGFAPLRCELPVAMHVLSLHHMEKKNRLGRLRCLYRRLATHHGLRKADLVITNTKFAVSQILALQPSVSDRLVQSFEAVRHDRFRRQPDPGEVEWLRDEYNLQPGYLFWCSNFYNYKRPELLLEAYALLDPAFRESMPIVMAGGGDWQDGWDAVCARAEELGIRENVTYLGWVPHESLGALYRQAKAFCLTSREETFGVPVIEAMACGTPCVLNEIPVMDEVARDSALMVDFENAEQAAEGLKRIATDTELRRSLIQTGLIQAQRFDFEKLARERIEAVRALAEPPEQADGVPVLT